MRIRFSFLVLLLACFFGFADAAWAWGPATHVGLASNVLDHLGLLAPAVAALLGRHVRAYRYGNIAADVVFAKKWSRVKQFCHHWSTAFRLLESAPDERTKAFAYGYLSHLAADTVAHGKYVPRQIAVSECSVNFGHLYWELRADNTESENTWRSLRELLAADHADDHAFLSRHITHTLLSYGTNRLLFQGMSTLTAREGFRRTVGVCNRLSRWPLSFDLLQGYRSECLDRIASVLNEGTNSPLLREDPNGTSALMHLRIHRRDVRRMERQSIGAQTRVREVSQGLAPKPLGDRLLRPLSSPNHAPKKILVVCEN